MFDFNKVIDRSGTYTEKWDIAEGELPMWVADMELETAPAVKEALIRRASHGIYGYTTVPDEWYDAYISRWKRYGLEIRREDMIYSGGVVAAISSIVRKLTTPAEKVLLLTPTYNIFYNCIVNSGRTVLECPLIYRDGVYTIDRDALGSGLADPQTSLMILCNPQNPTGNIWDRDMLAWIGETAERYGVVVLSDEAHCELTAPGKSYVPFASVSDICRRISVTCLSPAKTFNLAGLQTAAVIVYDSVRRHRVWRGINTDDSGEPNCFAVDAVIAAFTQSDDWLEALRAHIADNRRKAEKFIAKYIPRAHAVRSDATYLLWIDLGYAGRYPAKDIREKTGLFLSEGEIYGKGGEGFVRMNLACPVSQLEDGLARLKAWDETINDDIRL